VPKKNKNDEELHLLMSFLAESVAQMTDDQVKEEFRADPKPRTKEILKAALEDCRKQKLREARAEYESATKELSSRSYNLPHDKREQRALLSSILSRQSELRSLAFTAQHRELKDLTDEDVESFLRQLADLGLLASFLE
jgi:DNA-binding ferritin-like protein (Dps family)